MDGGEDSESVINEKEKYGGRLTSGDMGLFTGPHLHEKGRSVYCNQERRDQGNVSVTYQMSFSDEGSLTIRLSRGERPVLVPE